MTHEVDDGPMASIFDPDFDEFREQPGFRCRRARVGQQAGAERLGASVWELPPGQAAYPYHFHRIQEELLFVLSGRPALRTPDGWRDLAPGETVAFLVGERGAHQLVNRTDEDVRLLVVSPGGMPEILVYPDSDKVGVYEPSSAHDGHYELHRRDNAVDYYEGEEAPGATP
jgi:uncharacterized cupin superfamily protein